MTRVGSPPAPAGLRASGRAQQPPRSRAHVEDDGRLTAELAAALSGARRRARRDGDGQIDTAHLLHSLLEADPEVRAALGGVGDTGGDAPVIRVLGYLVQRSIGYGLRWHGRVEDSGAVPVVRSRAGRTVAGWSPSAVAALGHAWEWASRRAEPRVHGLDVLAALAADHECRAVEVMERAGVDTRALAGRLHRASRRPSSRQVSSRQSSRQVS
ncbi:Clp protease N-terminal domain-containing protein [Streptomyces sp. NPDC004749]